MAGPRMELVRKPAVAGLFYPADASECRAQASQLLQAFVGAGLAARPDSRLSQSGRGGPPLRKPEGESSARLTSLPRRLIGAVVPHAGWVCSGAIAGQTMTVLSRVPGEANLVVVFGAIHTPLATGRAPLAPNARRSEPTGAAQSGAQVRRTLR